MKLISSFLLIMFMLASGSLMAQNTQNTKASMRTNVMDQFCSFYGRFDFKAPDRATITSIQINFGDGSSATYHNSSQIAHIYPGPGTYSVTATVNYMYTVYTSGSNTVTGTITFTAPPTQAEYAGFSVSGSELNYSFNYTGLSFSGHSYTLDFGDGTTATGTSLTTGQPIASHTYTANGNYTVKLTHGYIAPPTYAYCSWVQETTVEAEAPPPDLCCSNFSPESGKEYWLSAWVQEAVTSQVTTYSNKVYVELEFTGSFAGSQYVRLYPSEDIVENWQRIVGRFTVPAGTTQIQIHTVNDNDYLEAYFDDVRIHPFNGSMKSYVYDPFTLLLTAELDDNNYATFYEYDKEGQLIRIKKETARGIMTIQESRSSNPKKPN